MRILFFSHYYPPEVNAPASRTSEHCQVWVREGHDVTVVTCVPSHPAGRIYPGYRNHLFQAEILDGVRVVRIWTLTSPSSGVLRRSLSFLSYFVTAILVMPWLPRADIVVSTSPQFFCGLVGLVARLVKRAPWVLEVRDLWPESIHAVGAMRQGPATRLLAWLEGFAYRKADRIVTVTSSFVTHIAERCGDPDKISLIRNGADLARFVPRQSGEDAKATLALSGRFIAAYVGTHGMAHGLGTILEAAELLRDDRNIVFLMVGDGAERERLSAERSARRLENVVMLGQRPKSDMPAVWQAADAGLILLRRTHAFRKVIPSKMLEAMAMRCPIVLGAEGEARELLEDAGAGVAITPESASELAATVRKLAADAELRAHLGANGAAYVRRHFDRHELALRYLEVIQATVRAAAAHSNSQLRAVGED